MTLASASIGARVVVKAQWPKWLAWLFDANAGAEGTIVSREIGKYSKEPLYGVVFAARKGEVTATAATYFENQLTLLPAS